MKYVGGCVHEPVRSVLRFESFLILIALGAGYWMVHGNWILFAVMLLAPDVAMLGYLRNTTIGAWCYNAAHTYAGAVILALASFWNIALLPFAVIWAAHVAFDRALGYGLKYGDSFQHTHLGIIGKARD